MAAPFTGILDGQGHRIANLTVNNAGRTNDDGVGLFGRVSGGTIRNVRLENVTASGSWNTGGLVGYLGSGSITNSSVSGTVSGGNNSTGGLVGGSAGGSVARSYSAATVTGFTNTGGLVGYNRSAITDSYSTGSVTSPNVDFAYSTGGLVGWNYSGTITRSYSTGAVSALVARSGGLIGENWTANTSNYWDTATSGRTGGCGSASYNCNGVTGLTDSAMHQQASFSGWDFAGTWGIVDGTTYPYLLWQGPPATSANEAPTDIGLSASSVAENQASGTTVGTLSTTDPDAGDTFAYSLVTGTGDIDNASFTIDGSTLKTAAVFDFEAKSSYSIRVRTTDAGSQSFEKAFVISVSNVNEAPTDISLSASTVAENQASGTTVGTFSTTDPDGGALGPAITPTFAYSLVTGAGDTDNASFTIDGSTLKTAAVFNFEAKAGYSIRVRSADGGGLFVEETFTITVSNVNEAPTDIGLTSSSVAEHQPSGTTVGTLSATDPDAATSFTYSLVAGTGSTDNASFTIDGSTLKTAAVFNYEAKSSYTIRIQTSDGSLAYEEAFTITVSNVNEAPTDISLTSSSVAEHQPSGTAVGTFGSTDPDGGALAPAMAPAFAYSLVSGTGSTDNSSFTISGGVLQTAGSFDYETKSSYSIRVRTTDAGALWFEEAFTITVSNVNEAPTDISLTSSSVAEGQPSGTAVGTLGATDPDAASSFTYSLVSGTGGDDNASFAIDGSTLKTAAVFDAETKSSYSIRVRVTDGGSLTYEEAFTIGVTSANEAPTDISLSASSVAENQASGTTVGTLGTTDPDAGDTFAYSLVTGTGDTDNASFTIDGSTLKTAAVFDYEAKSGYSIRVRTTDAGSQSFEKAFVISVSNVNEAPTISDVADQVIVSSGSTGPLAVTIGDPETAPSALTLGGTSSNHSLVPDANIVLGGSGASRTVTVTPVAGTMGSATITLTVGDGTLSATDTFLVTVGSGQPPKVVMQPGSQTITEGRNAAFTATGAGAPQPTVHWEVSTNRGKTWTDLTNGSGGIAGADTETLLLAGVTREMSGFHYRAVFTNQNGVVASNPATLTVKAVPTTRPGLIGTTVTLVSDENPSPDGTLTLTASVVPMSGTGVPTGQVTFLEGGIILGVAPVSAGAASLTLAAEVALPGGEHELSARYGGDATYNASASGTYHQVVGTTTTDVAITLSGQPSTAPGGLPGLTWTITAWNVGGAPASNVQVHMTLDNATRFVAVRPATGITSVVNGRAVTVLLGDLAAGATVTIEIDAVLAKAPRIAVTIPGKATVSTASLEMNPSNDSSTATVAITATLLATPPADGSWLAMLPETPLLTSTPRRRRRVRRRLEWACSGQRAQAGPSRRRESLATLGDGA